MASLDLAGKRAIVTGASSGIGRATAAALAAAGVRVAGGARRVERLETEVALELDVTDAASCEGFAVEAVERLGGLDILVNNAGLALGRAPFDESSEEDEATVLGVNVSGLVRMTRLCLPHFGDWGHIVNMGSVAGRVAYEGGASYVAAKFAERGFTYALREDLLGRPIRITTVDPGLTETEFALVRFKGDEEKAAAVYANVGLGGPLQPDDIADCILFAVTRPPHVSIDSMMVLARAQTTPYEIVVHAIQPGFKAYQQQVAKNGSQGPLEFPSAIVFIGNTGYISNYDTPRRDNLDANGKTALDGIGASIAQITP